MNRYFLVDSQYENKNSVVILYFSKNPLSKQYDYVYRQKYRPYFIIKTDINIIKEILDDFNNSIDIQDLENSKVKIKARNYKTLQKAHNLLKQSINKEILLIEPIRQYLINQEWSYYDSFYLFFRKKIKKVDGEDLVHKVVKKYLEDLDQNIQKKLIAPITRRLLISNILKTKPTRHIENDSILNILFENYFFKKYLIIEKNNRIEYNKSVKNILNTIKLDFSNIWPYLLQSKYNNIGYETLKCNCCKPKSIFDENILNNSLVKVEFLKYGFYFLSNDYRWSFKYHKSHNQKENRINYKRNNKLKQLPTGPFNKNQKEYILLSDAINLANNKYIKIIDKDLNKINWFCKKEKSFLSKLVEDLISKLKNIEKSINITNSLFYSKKLRSKNLENNPQFIQYLTEYSLINNLINEIPKFIQHKNTKFYNEKIDLAIKSIKLKTYNNLNKNDCKYIIDNQEIVHTRDKKLLKKINLYFPKLDLPIPKLIKN